MITFMWNIITTTTVHVLECVPNVYTRQGTSLDTTVVTFGSMVTGQWENEGRESHAINFAKPKTTFGFKITPKKIRGIFLPPGFFINTWQNAEFLIYCLGSKTIIMYKPYSPEWHRLRYLTEAIDKYLEDGVDPIVVLDDIRHILHVRSEAAYQEFQRINQLEHYLDSDECSQPNTDSD